MRPLALLPAVLVTGCLIQNPGFDPGEADSTPEPQTAESSATTSVPVATDATDTTDATDAAGTTLGGTGGDSFGSTTADPVTTGCALEPLFPDADNDGFGAGATVLACPGDPGLAGVDGDCDDADDAVNPGASELCNQRDDDCDGLKDEFSAANATCQDCELAEFAGHSYWFCLETAGWDAARSFCQDFGAVDLPIVDDAPENDFIFAGNAVPASPMWVGGRDSDPNMNAYYTCYDGSPLTFNNFALADLDDGCIALPNGDGGKWRDRDCGFDYSFACESKP